MATQEQAPVPEVIAVEMAKDRELRRQERQALTAIPAADLSNASARTTFLPQSMGEAMQLATIMARSTFVPQHCRGNEGNCLAIIMQAGRWGMDPFAVANKAYFTKDGAPAAFESQLVNAVVNSSGALSGRLRLEFDGQGEQLRCTVRGFLRADPNDEKVRTQAISRITVRNSPLWKSDPEQQLGYYTTRAWARLYCPEVLLGVYTPDEIDLDPERARVVSPPLPSREALVETATDDNPTAAEGRSDEQHGDQHDGSAQQAEEQPEPPAEKKPAATKADTKPAEPEPEPDSSQGSGEAEPAAQEDEDVVDNLVRRFDAAENVIDLKAVHANWTTWMPQLSDFDNDRCDAAHLQAKDRLGIAG